jgi:hypothetical protein
MIDQVTFVLQNYPWVQHVVAVLIVCRIVFKPLFAILGKYVELTIEEDDDVKLKKFMKSKTYKMLAFIVDLAASVKLPKIKEKK